MSINDERCANCKYCFKLKENNGQWDGKSVCVAFPMTESGEYDDFAMIVDKELDMCEMREGRK